MKTRVLLLFSAFLMGIYVNAQETDVPSDIFYDSIRNISELNDLGLGDAFPWISADGLRIYYTKGNFSEKRLVVASRPDTLSLFNAPTEVPGVASVNSISHWLSEDELTIYLCNGASLYVSKRSTINSPFAIPAQVSLSLPEFDYIYGPSLNSDESKLYINVNLQEEFLGIYVLTNNGHNSFEHTGEVSFPSGHLVHSGQLSKDDLVFFYSASVLESHDQLFMLKRTNTSEDFDAGTSMKIGGISDPDYINGQASMSEGLKWVAFVRSTGDGWNSNDLYLAHLSYPSAIQENGNNRDSFTVYPNPAYDKLIIEQIIPAGLNAAIYSADGNLMREFSLLGKQSTIDISGLSPGLYFIRIKGAAGIEVMKFVKS